MAEKRFRIEWSDGKAQRAEIVFAPDIHQAQSRLLKRHGALTKIISIRPLQEGEETMLEDKIAKMFDEDGNLSEEFKARCMELVNEVVAEKVVALLEGGVMEALAEMTNASERVIAEDLYDKVDDYLDYAGVTRVGEIIEEHEQLKEENLHLLSICDAIVEQAGLDAGDVFAAAQRARDTAYSSSSSDWSRGGNGYVERNRASVSGLGARRATGNTAGVNEATVHPTRARLSVVEAIREAIQFGATQQPLSEEELLEHKAERNAEGIRRMLFGR